MSTRAAGLLAMLVLLPLLLWQGVAVPPGAAAPAPTPPGPTPAPSPSPRPAPSPTVTATPAIPPPSPAPSPAGSPAAATAATVTFTLGTTGENPAVRPDTPRAATGSGALVVNAARTELGIVITFSGLSGPISAAHFHRGQPGEAGAVVQTICGQPAPALVASCPTAAGGTIAGVWQIPANLAVDLMAGRLYVNLHTALNPGGEIRGQLTPPR